MYCFFPLASEYWYLFSFRIRKGSNLHYASAWIYYGALLHAHQAQFQEHSLSEVYDYRIGMEYCNRVFAYRSG